MVVTCGIAQRRGLALGATAPVRHLGLVDLESVVVCCLQAGHRTHAAVHVDYSAAATANEVVMVVTNTILVQGRRAARLDTSHQAEFDERVQRVVHGLT